MNAAHLAKLNPEQRRAVEHGGPSLLEATALLIIAGAGSGKTNTLAHRVAHLIVGGIDPRRIMLLTFSRRAAAEMQRRVERITSEVLGPNARALGAGMNWSGTFHAIGARLLREYASEIELNREFTIHDREDSADLINLVRHDLGLSNKDRRFPMKGTCLSIYSRTVNAQANLEEILNRHFSWCAEWETELRRLFAAYVEAKQGQNVLDYDDLLLYWAHMMAEGSVAEQVAARFDHVLVDEYQDTNRLQASILLGLKPTGRGLTVVGDDAQSIYSFRAATVRNILDFPHHFSPKADIVTLDQNYRSTVPILDAANAVIELAAERFTKNLWSDRRSAERPLLVHVADDVAQSGYVVERILENREAGIALKAQAVLFRASHHSASLEIELTRRNIPFVKFGGLKFLEAAHIKDVLAIMRWAENPRDRVSGFRVAQLMPGIGPAVAGRLLNRIAESSDASEAVEGFNPPAGRRRVLAEVRIHVRELAPPLGWLACRARSGMPVVRAAPREPLRRRGDSSGRSRPALRDRVGIPEPRALPDRAHARPTRRDQRRGGNAASRRGLPHPLDNPFGEGPGMEIRIRAEHRRRLHTFGLGRRNQRGDRRRTPAALCRHDARERSAPSFGAATLLRPRTAGERGQTRLRAKDSFHPGFDHASLRELHVADRNAGPVIRSRPR